MTPWLSLRTAGVVLEVHDSTGRHASSLSHAAGSPPSVLDDRAADYRAADVRVCIDREHRAFSTAGMQPVTRGVWRAPDAVVLHSVGGSGFSQLWRWHDDQLEVRARWSPTALEAGATVMAARRNALRAQVLVHHPALWAAAARGLAPLHVSVLELDGVVALLAGPGGVGKSTMVAQALQEGARATCDNVAASDGEVAHGLREPLRLDAADGVLASGPRTTHGRREVSWSTQVPALRPDVVVVVRRGDGPRVREVPAREAQRALVAGTYAAGELRRFWSLAACVGLASGRGPVHPPVDEVARRLTTRLPCLEVELGATPGVSLHDLLAPHLHRTLDQEASP